MRASHQCKTNTNFTLQLAKGASGAVYRGFLYERLVACKVLVSIDMQSVDSFLTEAVLLSTCSHPSIIQLMGVCLDPREPSIMLEYASEGSLKDYLSSDSVLHTLSDGLLALLVHVTQGLCFVHARHCVHRDIKVGHSRSHSLSDVYVQYILPLCPPRSFVLDLSASVSPLPPLPFAASLRTS